MDRPVDVAISVYGKPWQTAAALLTLLKFSGGRINKIWFQEEPAQPFGDSVAQIPALLGDRVVAYTPEHFLGWLPVNRSVLAFEPSRLSVRYQLPWERSDRDYLFVLHNDTVFFDDVIGAMLKHVDEGFAGVGPIGQCWNCPAYAAGLCDGERHETFSPSYEEACALVEKFPGVRTGRDQIDRDSPMPFPECRLNEMACLIHLKALRALVMPHGACPPFGWMGLVDRGVDWFRFMRLHGRRFKNWGWRDGMAHTFFEPQVGGHPANFDIERYRLGESNARAFVERHFGDFAQKLGES